MTGKKRGKRLFGSVRQLPSGRWQARYLGPDGAEHRAPETFPTERDADHFLAEVQTDIRRGDWLNPDAGEVEFRVYAKKWVAERDLKPRPRQEYERILRLHILPILGGKSLPHLKPPVIRSWRKALQDNEVGKSTVAKSYRTLKAILNTAVDDEHPAGTPAGPRALVRLVPSIRPFASTTGQRWRRIDRLGTSR